MTIVCKIILAADNLRQITLTLVLPILYLNPIASLFHLNINVIYFKLLPNCDCHLKTSQYFHCDLLRALKKFQNPYYSFS